MSHGVTWRGGFLEEAKFLLTSRYAEEPEKCSGFRRKINGKGGGQEYGLHQGRGGWTQTAGPPRLCGAGSALRFQGFVNPRKSLTRHWLLCGDHRFQFRLRWNHDPGQYVRDHARTDSRRKSKEDAEDAHEPYVEIEILS